MQELELKRQAFELKLFEMNRTLNEKAEKASKAAENSSKRVTYVLIFFAILEVTFGAASVLQLAYPAGWPWLMKLVGSMPQPPSIPAMPEF